MCRNRIYPEKTKPALTKTENPNRAGKTQPKTQQKGKPKQDPTKAKATPNPARTQEQDIRVHPSSGTKQIMVQFVSS